MDITLSARLLPASLICKGFIKGLPDCDYEFYLREMVNASAYFEEKSKGKGYTAPVEEAHGEWDCISDSYSLDFKLIASETALRARNLFSGGIYKMAEGITAYCAPKIETNDPKYKPIQATRIFTALRPFDIDALKEIRNCNEKQQGVKTDIKALLATLETPKHILMFFPYEFFTETNNDFATVVSDIINALSEDIKSAFQYRKEVAPGLDSYLTFIYRGKFILTKVTNNGLSLIDTVDEKSCSSYMKLKSYTKWT